jgi:hypothetical protein
MNFFIICTLLASACITCFDIVWLAIHTIISYFTPVSRTTMTVITTVVAFNWFVLYLTHVQLLLIVGPLIVK